MEPTPTLQSWSPQWCNRHSRNDSASKTQVFSKKHKATKHGPSKKLKTCGMPMMPWSKEQKTKAQKQSLHKMHPRKMWCRRKLAIVGKEHTKNWLRMSTSLTTNSFLSTNWSVLLHPAGTLSRWTQRRPIRRGSLPLEKHGSPSEPPGPQIPRKSRAFSANGGQNSANAMLTGHWAKLP